MNISMFYKQAFVIISHGHKCVEYQYICTTTVIKESSFLSGRTISWAHNWMFAKQDLIMYLIINTERTTLLICWSCGELCLVTTCTRNITKCSQHLSILYWHADMVFSSWVSKRAKLTKSRGLSMVIFKPHYWAFSVNK